VDRYAISRHGESLSKQHEAKKQELRHERKTELDRLDGLKKSLQTKLHTDQKNETRAA
jgi:hypothetical protein